MKYFGDSFYLDTETWEWSPGPAIRSDQSNSSEGEVHNRRVGQTMTLIERAASGGTGVAQSAVALFGGQAPDDSRRNDMQVLKL